jgi:hypothetical protein
MTATTVPITLVLGGTNFNSYKLTNSVLNANVIGGVTNKTPTLSINTVNILKTVGVFNFTVNTNGIVFYSLALGNNSTPLDVLSLKVDIKSMGLIVQSQQDFLTYIYMSDRDYRLNMMTVATGQNSITFYNLLP